MEEARWESLTESERRHYYWDDMSPTERKLRMAIWTDSYHGHGLIPSDELGRRIVVTPFGGAYGNLGVVLAIEGTPPHGLYVVRGWGRAAVVWDVTNEYRARKPITEYGPKSRLSFRAAILDYLESLGESLGWAKYS